MSEQTVRQQTVQTRLTQERDDARAELHSKRKVYKPTPSTLEQDLDGYNNELMQLRKKNAELEAAVLARDAVLREVAELDTGEQECIASDAAKVLATSPADCLATVRDALRKADLAIRSCRMNSTADDVDVKHTYDFDETLIGPARTALTTALHNIGDGDE